jgi:hypothetical protein
MAVHSNNEVMRLASAGSLQEAQLWKAAIEQAGIQCQLVGLSAEHAVGLPELWIHRDDAERVRLVLRAHLRKGSPRLQIGSIRHEID